MRYTPSPATDLELCARNRPIEMRAQGVAASPSKLKYLSTETGRLQGLAEIATPRRGAMSSGFLSMAARIFSNVFKTLPSRLRCSSIKAIVTANKRETVNNVAIIDGPRLADPKIIRQSGIPMKPQFEYPLVMQSIILSTGCCGECRDK